MNSSERLETMSKAEIETLYEQILDAVPDMSLLKTPGSRLVWADTIFRSACGMSAGHFEKVVDNAHYRPEFKRHYVESDDSVFEKHETGFVSSEPLTCADGEVSRVSAADALVVRQGAEILRLSIDCDILESAGGIPFESVPKMLRSRKDAYAVHLLDALEAFGGTVDAAGAFKPPVGLQ